MTEQFTYMYPGTVALLDKIVEHVEALQYNNRHLAPAVVTSQYSNL